MARPRYFACSTASRTWPCRTYWVLHIEIWGFTDVHDLALAGMEVHFPSLFTMFEFYEVLLKGLGVIFASYCQKHMYSSIVSE